MLSKHKSGFRQGDSCIFQLLAIIHDIFSSFDCRPTLETRSVFLDKSKAFDRVWNNGLLLKLRQNGVGGYLFQLIKSFLSSRFQRVLLNGQTWDWETIQTGVSQGSILGPLFFLLYISYLTDNLNSNVKLFDDDSSLSSEICHPLETANVLNNDLIKLRAWAEQWKIVLNPDPTKQAQEVIFARKSHSVKHPDLHFNNTNKGIGMLKKLGKYLPRHSFVTLYKAFVRPHLDYAEIIYDKQNNMNICNKKSPIQFCSNCYWGY